MVNTKNKKVIGFNDSDYRTHLNASYNKLKVLNDGIAEFTTVLGCSPIGLKTFPDTMVKQAVDYITSKHKEGLVLGLDQNKFISLYGYNLDRLKAIQKVYNGEEGTLALANDFWVVDDRYNDFNIVAETPEEIERLKDAQIFADALNVLYKKYLAGSGVIPNGVNLYKFVTADLSNNGMYIVNDQFVKQY